MAEQTLTPTEDLILDVLVARFRLGETIWPFDRRNEAALRRLESRGLINRMGGNVEGTERAWLTEKALHEHGASWFQLETTARYLNDHDHNHMGWWCKSDVQILAELPQTIPETDPRAVNAVHLLMILAISRNRPVFDVARGPDGGLTVHRHLTHVAVAPDGLSYRLLRSGIRPETTSDRDEVLRVAYQGDRG